MSKEEAEALINRDARNADVLFPYVNGEDLNSRPDSTGSRWIINFFDWPEEHAKAYPDCYEIVRQRVKPARDRNTRESRRRYWWRYEPAPALRSALTGLSHVLAIAQTSNVVLPVRVSSRPVYDQKTIGFQLTTSRSFLCCQAPRTAGGLSSSRRRLNRESTIHHQPCFRLFRCPT